MPYTLVHLMFHNPNNYMGINGVMLRWRKSAIYGKFVNVGTQ